MARTAPTLSAIALLCLNLLPLQARAQAIGSAAVAPITLTERAVPTAAADLQLSYASVVKRAAPAVVNIFSTKIVRTGPRSMAELFAQQFGGAGPTPPRVEQSLGSGVIVSADGLIVTNNHVVGGADQILVALADLREFTAKIVFADARTDLAVLKIDTKGAVLPTVQLANSDAVEVGDIVLAIGDPFGFGQSVSHGIVSALARNGLGASDRQFFIQSDAAINPGNSGGALLDMQGRLIGINTAIFSQTGNSVGIGFAIPANMVKTFLKAAPSGKLVTGWMGAEGEGLTAESARALGFDRPGGVLITGVAAGSPAAIAGMRVGDVLTAVGANPVADAGQLRYRLATEGVGETVQIALIRDHQAITVSMTLIAPPETPLRAITPISGNNLLNNTVIANLSPAYAQELGLGLPERGVVVVTVAANAPALRLVNLRAGDIIESVNGVEVVTVGTVLRALTGGTPAIRFKRGPLRFDCSIGAQLQVKCTK